MPGYKLTIKNAKVVLKTIADYIINLVGIKDNNTGTGNVTSGFIDWKIQHYSDTAANFTSLKPVLLVGQLGIETDALATSPKFKIGDGLTAWNSLPYVSSGGAGNLIYKINTPISHTGTTAATVISSYLISAGTVQANDFLKFSLRHYSTNNTNLKTIKLYANTSNTISGATQLATYAYATNSGGVIWFKRNLLFQNSLSSQKIINTTVSHANDEISYPNNGDSSLSLNFANDVWILIQVTLANSGDTFTLNAFMNEIDR